MNIVNPHAQKLINTSPTLAHRSGKCKPEIWAYSHGLHCVWELPDLSWNSQLFPVSVNTELPTSQWNHNAPSAWICLCGEKKVTLSLVGSLNWRDWMVPQIPQQSPSEGKVYWPWNPWERLLLTIASIFLKRI